MEILLHTIACNGVYKYGKRNIIIRKIGKLAIKAIGEYHGFTTKRLYLCHNWQLQSTN
jgi:hypothetical protein